MRVRLYHLPVLLPRAQAPRGPFINIMPVGLLALADRLARDGHEVEVVHGGVERRLDPAFDVVADLEARPADLVGLALHWHPQLGPVGDAVARLHAAFPLLPVVLGGITASAFAEPIVGRWQGVAAVIAGEGEEPLAALAGRLAEGRRDFGDLPNLVTRGPDGTPQRSASRYVASQASFDALEFTRLELLRHHQHYNGQFAETARGWSHPPVFYLGIGRGCSVDCAFCSGGRSGHRRVAGRREVVFRSVPRVLDDLRHLAARAHHTGAICFDPPGRSDGYYRELFGAIAASPLRPALVFECYQPPTEAFLDGFTAAVRVEESRLSFSPTVGDEALRSRLLGVHYDNAALEQTLARCQRRGIATTLYFATVPQESRAQLDRSLAWQRALADTYGCRIIHAPIEMEPEAPWARAPRKYHLAAVRTGFDAFEGRHRDAPRYGVRYRDELGFDFPDVDARVVRVASALTDPAAWLSVALTTCGQGQGSRVVLVGPGQVQRALGLLEPQRGRALTLLVASEEPMDPWAHLPEVAERLGSQVRWLPFLARRLRHVTWRGGKPPSPAPGELKVLHLADAAAAGRLWERAPRALSPGVIVAELCRWVTARCPARGLGLVALGREGSLRCCPSAPVLPAASLDDTVAWLRARREATLRERGCARCPVEETCSQCLFPGRLSAAEFCELRRQLGRGEGAGVSALLARLPSLTGGDIGWDD